MKIAVIIASVGRRDLLCRTVALLARQTRLPDRVIVCGAGPEDTAGVVEAAPFPVDVIEGPRGSSSQRNAGLRHLRVAAEWPEEDSVAAFFDDDFVPGRDYLAVLEQEFSARPTLAGATSALIADGIKTPGISLENALALLDRHVPDPALAERSLPALYGCNLCVRLSAARDVWFDEALPLYGWQEDVDFSYRVGARGALVLSPRLAGVHLGAKGGRTSGKRLGYSQIANPVYLLRKRTIPPRLALRLMVRNLLANCARSLWPEPYVDRAGRLAGNVTALADLLRGRIHPQRILEL